MSDFHELLDGARNPGEDGVSPTIYDDLESSYNTAGETAAARIAELEASLAEGATKLQSVMAHNYELLQAVSNTPDPTATNPEPDGADDEVELEPIFTYDD